VALEKKDYDTACARFEASEKLDPAPGTLFNLATCEEGRGRFGAAARRWKEALDLLPAGDPRRAKVQENALAAEKKAGHLVLRLSPQAPPTTTVTLDDLPLSAAEIGVAVSVDAGAHRIVVSAPGHEPRTITVTTTVEAPTDVALTPGPVAVAPPAIRPPAVLPSSTSQPPAQSGLARHKASLSLLGAGVLLAGVGAGLSGDILGRYHAFVQKCVGPGGCPQADKDGMKTEAAAVSALFSVAGAAGLAAVGVYLFAERGPSAVPGAQVGLVVGPTGAKVTLSY
jgi:hypothetical protein